MTDVQVDLPRFASGVTAVYGLSGSGKSSLADTAAEYVAERFSLGTMCIAGDPGGWGNRRLSLIRQGIMQVYDPRNHVNFFETMELLSLGAFPESLIDPDRGYADPNVRLLKPRQLQFVSRCPQGHVVGRYDSEAVMVASVTACPTCGVLTSAQNMTTEKVWIKPAIFKRIGLRIFDSITAANDQGLTLELPKMSAAGELPVSRTGGSALGSADAVRQGNFVVGTGSEAQVGFMQNRTYGWLVNIRTIPDQVLGAICTFGVEESKDDARGGELSYGPAIAGKARTARVPGWVGNCLHATKEPDGLLDAQGLPRMRHRLWLTNHIDPRDISKRPYLAKHRGTPLGMPDFLEDPWDDDREKRDAAALTVCSLKHFFQLLERQYVEIDKADQARFAGFREAAGQADDEVLATEVVAAVAAVPAANISPASGRGLSSRTLRRPGAAVPAAAPSLIVQQLEASLAAQVVVTAPAANGGAGAPTTVNAPAAKASAGTPSLPVPPVPSTPPAVRASTPAAPAPVAPGRLRRVARPPV